MVSLLGILPSKQSNLSWRGGGEIYRTCGNDMIDQVDRYCPGRSSSSRPNPNVRSRSTGTFHKHKVP
jgi:hypothetical protein